MKFKEIVLVYRDNLSKEAINRLKTIEKILDKFKKINYSKLEKKDLKGFELIISFGGDGTFIRAANLAENQFILGINQDHSKSEGYLTSLNSDEIGDLKKILAGNFKVIERQRAEIKLNGKFLEEKAINEVYVGCKSQIHSSRYKIKFKGFEEEQRSSGIIITTGTGSTAWYKSAGGIPFRYDEKKLCFIVREPYFGERLFKPKILNGTIWQNEKLTVQSLRHFGGIISIGEKIYNFNFGDVAEIFLSDMPLKVLIKNDK